MVFDAIGDDRDGCSLFEWSRDGAPGCEVVVEEIELDAYILDTLMRDLVGHDHRPSAFLVYLYLWRATGGRTGVEVSRSLRQISEGTGLSKRAVQTAIQRLKRRHLITVNSATITAVPDYQIYRPWRRRQGNEGA